MNKIHTLEPGNEEITAKKIITVSDARLNFFRFSIRSCNS